MAFDIKEASLGGTKLYQGREPSGEHGRGEKERATH